MEAPRISQDLFGRFDSILHNPFGSFHVSLSKICTYICMYIYIYTYYIYISYIYGVPNDFSQIPSHEPEAGNPISWRCGPRRKPPQQLGRKPVPRMRLGTCQGRVTCPNFVSTCVGFPWLNRLSPRGGHAAAGSPGQGPAASVGSSGGARGFGIEDPKSESGATARAASLTHHAGGAGGEGGWLGQMAGVGFRRSTFVVALGKLQGGWYKVICQASLVSRMR